MRDNSTTSPAAVDDYGNNIGFPDDILSDMTNKGLLGKWIGYLVSEVRSSLYSFYVKTNNVDCGDVDFVTKRFVETKMEIDYILPVLEDLVDANIHGFEDICIAIYGVESDEVFLVRRFLQQNACMSEWKSSSMWTDCGGDLRLLNILL